MKQNPPRRHFSNTSRGNRPHQPASPGRGHDSVMDSTGPGGKIRGTSQQIMEKYMNLGRDALSSGDYVMSESFFQYAEHYRRLISLKREERQERQIVEGSQEAPVEETHQPSTEMNPPHETHETQEEPPLHLSENKAKIKDEDSLNEMVQSEGLPAFLSAPTRPPRSVGSSRTRGSTSSQDFEIEKPKVRRRPIQSKVETSETGSSEE